MPVENCQEKQRLPEVIEPIVSAGRRWRCRMRLRAGKRRRSWRIQVKVNRHPVRLDLNDGPCERTGPAEYRPAQKKVDDKN